MKNLYLILLSILITSGTYATHLMGGEVTARQMHDSTYEITLTTYRDTLGIPMDKIANFIVKDTGGNTVMTFKIPYDTVISGSALRLYFFHRLDDARVASGVTDTPSGHCVSLGNAV